MALQAETVVSGLVSTWQANATLASLVPGGIWYGQAPQDESRTRATIVVSQEGAIIEAATREYIQNVSIEVTLYATKTMTNADWQTIREAINSIWTVNNPPASGAKFITINPASSSVELAPERRDGEDVLIAKANYVAMLQGAF